jgi:hypothetical protein
MLFEAADASFNESSSLRAGIKKATLSEFYEGLKSYTARLVLGLTFGGGLVNYCHTFMR